MPSRRSATPANSAGEDRFGPREIFGGILETEKSTGYHALSIVLGAGVVARVRSTYPDYLRNADKQAYRDFLRDRFPPDQATGSPGPGTAPFFLVGVTLPNGELASGVALSTDGAVVTAWPDQAATGEEFGVFFRGDTASRRARLERADFGLAVLALVESARPLRDESLPQISALDPSPADLIAFAVSADSTSAYTASQLAFVTVTDEGSRCFSPASCRRPRWERLCFSMSNSTRSSWAPRAMARSLRPPRLRSGF